MVSEFAILVEGSICGWSDDSSLLKTMFANINLKPLQKPLLGGGCHHARNVKMSPASRLLDRPGCKPAAAPSNPIRVLR